MVITLKLPPDEFGNELGNAKEWTLQSFPELSAFTTSKVQARWCSGRLGKQSFVALTKLSIGIRALCHVAFHASYLKVTRVVAPLIFLGSWYHVVQMRETFAES